MATSPLDVNASIPSRIIELAQPGLVTDTIALRPYRAESTPSRDAWQVMIDRTLTRWICDSIALKNLEDDGIDAPSKEAMANARELAYYLRDAGLPAPLRIVPTGDGGVTFQYESGTDFDSIETDAGGKSEFFHFQHDRLVSRFFLAMPRECSS
jgi:hypothetical protein